MHIMRIPATSQCLRRVASRPASLQTRWFTSDRVVQPNDTVLLRQRGDKKAKWRLSPRLRASEGEGEGEAPPQRVRLSYGAHVLARDLIGRRYLDVVRDSSGRQVVIHEASVAGYVNHSERMATPIYPQDCNVIVAMLDLCPERPGESDVDGDEGVFEVFEAGTGMGSLTLHMARALHAGNAPMTREMRDAVASAGIRGGNGETPGSETSSEVASEPDDPSGSSSSSSKAVQSLTLSRLDTPADVAGDLASWSSSRRAVLHTLDRNPAHARAAYRLLQRFRRAMYLPTVDFHIGSVAGYLEPRLASSGGKPFLSRAVLDMPAPEAHADPVVRALRPNGLLAVFNPSVSQIAAFAKWAVATGQPLGLERVAELPNSTQVAADEPGANDGGGRAWDVRTVVPRDAASPDDYVQVMRPKVGDRIGGGGFVALFRRMHPRERKGGNGEGEEVPSLDEM